MQQRRAGRWAAALAAAVVAVSVAWVTPVTAAPVQVVVPQTASSPLCGATGTDVGGAGCQYDTAGTDTFTAPYYQPEVTFSAFGGRSRDAEVRARQTLEVTPGARYEVTIGGGKADVRDGAYGRSDRLVVAGDGDVRGGTGLVTATWPDGPTTATVDVTSSEEEPVDPDTWVTLTVTVTTSTGVPAVGTVRFMDYTGVDGSSDPRAPRACPCSRIPGDVIDSTQDGTYVKRVRAGSLANGPDHSIVAIFEDRHGEIRTVRSAPVAVSVADPEPSTATEVDLGLSLTADPGPITAGSDLAYTLGVTNYSATTATSVDSRLIARDVSGDGVSLSAEGTSSICTSLPTEVAVVCDFGEIAAGATETATVVLTAQEAGELLASASFFRPAQPDPSPINDVVSLETLVDPTDPLPSEPQASLSISTEGPDRVAAGEVITYRITAGNQGPDAASGVTATDVLPDGVTFSPDATSPACRGSRGAVSCDVGDLEVGQRRTFEIGVTADRLGPILNTVTIAGDQLDPRPGTDNFSTATTMVQPTLRPADLSIGVTAPDRMAFGDRLTYRIAVTNDGPNDATEVTATDRLPSHVRFASAGTSATCRPDVARTTVTCDFGTVTAGQTETAEITVLAGEATQVFNSATVEANEPDPDTSNNASTVSTRVQDVSASADLSIEKSASTDQVRVGKDITYRLEVRNLSPTAAFDVAVTEALPAEVSFKQAGTSAGCTHASGVVTCDIGRIPGQQTAEIEIVATAEESGLVSSTATVEGGGLDQDPSNDVATVITQIDDARETGVVGLAMRNNPVSEGGTASVTVTRIGGSAGSVSIDYATSNGTAGSEDYTPISGTLVFSDGDTTKAFSITTNEDDTPEFNETIIVTLTSPTSNATIGRAESTVTIVDDDSVGGIRQR